jgi:hypothetical protein
LGDQNFFQPAAVLVAGAGFDEVRPDSRLADVRPDGAQGQNTGYTTSRQPATQAAATRAVPLACLTGSARMKNEMIAP